MTSLFTLLRPPSLEGIVVLLLALPLLVSCDDGTLNAPDATNDAFKSYVAVGNSITAGFQSGGLNQTRQQQSYAVLLSEQMNTRFNLPTIPNPGCPPPLQSIFTGARINGASPTTCTLRETPIPSTVHNVAVPSAKVFDALSNLDPNAPGQPPDPTPNILTSLILGGQTQVQAAARAHPTFASVWLGQNDVLGAALNGEADGTAPPTFEQHYMQVVDQLQAAGAQRGLLIGVADVTFSPHFSPGQAYAAAEQQINALGAQASENWGEYDVLDSCRPGNPGANTLVPFAYGFGVLFAQALEGATVELDCAPDTAPSPVLTPGEIISLRQRISAYNAVIQGLAETRGWAFLNPNPTFQALYLANASDANPANDLVPKFPNPALDQPTFGRYFSEDGIHPAGALHRVITFIAIQAINETYSDEGISLQQVSIPDEVASVLQ